MMRGGHLDVCVLGAFQVSAARRPRQLAHRRAGRDPRRRRRDGPRHRRQAGLRDDDAVRQGRRRPSSCRACTYPLTGVGCVEPRLHRPRGLPGRPGRRRGAARRSASRTTSSPRASTYPCAAWRTESPAGGRHTRSPEDSPHDHPALRREPFGRDRGRQLRGYAGPAAARGHDLARHPPARLRQGRASSRAEEWEAGDRVPHRDRPDVRRRRGRSSSCSPTSSGVSMLVETSTTATAGGGRPSPPCSGPFHVVESPPRELGDDIDARRQAGEPCLVTGRVRRTPTARRSPGAQRRRLAGQRRRLLRRAAARRAARANLRGLFTTDADGRLLVPHDRARALPDPDGRPGRRAAARDRPAPVPPGPHPLHRLRARLPRR